MILDVWQWGSWHGNKGRTPAKCFCTQVSVATPAQQLCLTKLYQQGGSRRIIELKPKLSDLGTFTRFEVELGLRIIWGGTSGKQLQG